MAFKEPASYMQDDLTIDLMSVNAMHIVPPAYQIISAQDRSIFFA